MSNQTLAAAQPVEQAAPVAESFATPDDLGDLRASELHASLGEELSAEASESFMSGLRGILRLSEYSAAGGTAPDFGGMAPPQLYDAFDPAKMPSVPIATARQRVKEEGLEPFLKLPEQPEIKEGVLDLMTADARERARYNAAIARGPSGFIPDALGAATQIGLGMIDPVNIAAFSIPVVGEARYGKLLASAGESILGRAAIRAGVGAAQGAVGGAALTPLDWLENTQDGADYTFADALKSVVMSAGMGGAFHAGGGFAGDVLARLSGRPLAGAPSTAGTPLPEAALGEGVDLDEIPGIAATEKASAADLSAHPDRQVMPMHPAEVLADLPPAAQENVVQASIANLIADRPNNAAEMLGEAAKVEPRIEQSVGAQKLPDGREIVPGPAPGTLRTGRPAVDAVLDDPAVADAIANGPVNRKNGVPYEAGASNGDDPTTNLDRFLPRLAVLKSGHFDPAVPAKIHEQVEKRAMELLIAKKQAEVGRALTQDEIDKIYEIAHHEYAEPAEDAWYRSQGLDIDEVNRWWAQQDRITEHEKPIDPPANLYTKPYPHNEVEGVRHEETGVAAEWPTTTQALDGTAGGRAGDNVVPFRGAGAGDRAAQQPDWASLKPKPDDDDGVRDAAAQAAGAPEPPATPEKAVSAAQAAAGEAEKLLADILPQLSEEERKGFEQKLADLKNDEEARSLIARDAAACLAAAIGEAA